VLEQTEERLRNGSSQLLHLIEAALYIAVGLLLAAAAIAVLWEAGAILWRGIASRTVTGYGLQVLDQLLLVLVLVEILHTVRISIRSQAIPVEPFLGRPWLGGCDRYFSELDDGTRALGGVGIGLCILDLSAPPRGRH